MAVTIRRARLSDLDQLVALWQELSEFHVALHPQFALVPDAAKHYREHAASANPIAQSFWRKMEFKDYMLRLRASL